MKISREKIKHIRDNTSIERSMQIKECFMFGIEWDNDTDALDIGIYFWPICILGCL